MKIYIAGPMRGIPEHNYPAFDNARDELQAQGFSPVSPADLDREAGVPTDPEASIDIRACLRRACEALLECDAIGLLEGWEDSLGARAEASLAAAAGMAAFSIQTLPENPNPPS